MKKQKIEEVVVKYLNNPKTDYALLVDGEWGSGKTYFLTHSLNDIITSADSGKAKRRKYAFVSLYGMKSISDFTKEIYLQYLGKKHKRKVETVGIIASSLASAFTASLGYVNIDLSEVKNVMSNINFQDWIICIDDFERTGIPIYELLGFINKLVEFNNCKVIILANEKEVGCNFLSTNYEKKIQTAISLYEKLHNNTNEAEKNSIINIIKADTKEIFNEDILYRTLKEKTIGITIEFEQDMDRVYMDLIEEWNKDSEYVKYLAAKKDVVLRLFDQERCNNIRILIAVLDTMHDIIMKMQEKSYTTCGYYERIADEFLKYVVLFSIYYMSGGKIDSVCLKDRIGYVHLSKIRSQYYSIKGFKFIEQYCLYKTFSEEDFISTFSALKKEYTEIDEKEKQNRMGFSGSLCKLFDWRLMEDQEVNHLIKEMINELLDDKYAFISYQEILYYLIILEEAGFKGFEIDNVIKMMNNNIEKTADNVDIEKYGYDFKNEELHNRYKEYFNKLRWTIDKTNIGLLSEELNEILKNDTVDEFVNFCKKHNSDFYKLRAFSRILNKTVFIIKVKNASAKELTLFANVFESIYDMVTVREYLSGDLESLMDFKSQIEVINNDDGINKPFARKALIAAIDQAISKVNDPYNNSENIYQIN